MVSGRIHTNTINTSEGISQNARVMSMPTAVKYFAWLCSNSPSDLSGLEVIHCSANSVRDPLREELAILRNFIGPENTFGAARCGCRMSVSSRKQNMTGRDSGMCGDLSFC